MSDYYKVPRDARWNYDPKGKNNWKLSRSKIDLFVECPRCFYIDNRFGVKRPPMYPYNLNSAVDTLLKKENQFTEDFEKNKLVLGSQMPSKKIRNQVAGYITRIKKRKD